MEGALRGGQCAGAVTVNLGNKKPGARPGFRYRDSGKLQARLELPSRSFIIASRSYALHFVALLSL